MGTWPQILAGPPTAALELGPFVPMCPRDVSRRVFDLFSSQDKHPLSGPTGPLSLRTCQSSLGALTLAEPHPGLPGPTAF